MNVYAKHTDSDIWLSKGEGMEEKQNYRHGIKRYNPLCVIYKQQGKTIIAQGITAIILQPVMEHNMKKY